SNRENSFYARVASKLARGGLMIDVKIIADGLSEADAFAREIERIAYWRAQDVRLVNLTDGGEGPSGYRHSAETKQKMSMARTGQKRSPEACANMSKARKGQKHGPPSVEARANMRAAQLGRKHSAETRAKISAAHIGMSYGPLPPEQRAKMSAASKGHSKSLEHCANISAGLKGRVITAEWRAKLSDAAKRRKPRWRTPVIVELIGV